MKFFITTLRKHSIFGYIISACFVEEERSGAFRIVEHIIYEDVLKNKSLFSKNEIEITRLISSYSESNILKIFSRQKNINTFLKNTNSEYIATRIRPFIEQKIEQIIHIIRTCNIPLYVRDEAYTTIYDTDQITLRKDPANIIFNIRRTDNGTFYNLSAKYNRREIQLYKTPALILINKPAYLLINSSLHYFQDIDAKKLLPFFSKKNIFIPQSIEKKWFESFAKSAIKNFEVNASGFVVEEKHFDPQTEAVLNEDFTGQYVIMLYFRYGEKKYAASARKDYYLEFDKENFSFIKYMRTPEIEKKIIEEILENSPLEYVKDGFFKIKNNTDTNKNEALLKALPAITNLFKILNIKFIQNIPDKQYFTGDISPQISLGENKDWFDVNGTVQFGEFQIPFIKLRNHLLEKNKEYELPDGSIALLPDEWFEKYTHLFLFGQKKGHTLTLSKTHIRHIESSGIKGLPLAMKENFMHLIKYKEYEVAPPKNIRATLRPYQKDGLQWMYLLQKNNMGGCLADDMGLGKTLQTITLLQKTINETAPLLPPAPSPATSMNLQNMFDFAEAPKKASLIVMPVSLIHNWKEEIKKFAPNLKVLEYRGLNRERYLPHFKRYDIILAGYTVVRNDIEQLQNYEFLYLILDESQAIKNAGSKTYKAITHIVSDYRMALTGTPIENSLSDLWSQMNFLNKGMLGTRKFFKEMFINPIEKMQAEEQAEKLKNMIAPFILRRTKKQVLKELPPLTEQTVFCENTPEQKKYYEKEKSKMRNQFLGIGDKKNELSLIMLSALTKLRLISNHPVLFDADYQGESGKFCEVIRMLESLISGDAKVLIFSSFVKHLHLLADYLKEHKIKYSELTGASKERDKIIDQFQKDPKNQVFLISIKAGGTGLNLTQASYVFILDPWWNPAVERQAVSRAHRMGQDKKVTVYKFISAGTVEEKIIALQEKKKELSGTFINPNNPLSGMSESKIMELFFNKED
ncbi:MAG: hypothetical protein CSB06_03580 [Bacteroidia bacterium]|nr:MAG: hypothetical protein CSB06_03580 [Bacteroidia bacterium]